MEVYPAIYREAKYRKDIYEPAYIEIFHDGRPLHISLNDWRMKQIAPLNKSQVGEIINEVVMDLARKREANIVSEYSGSASGNGSMLLRSRFFLHYISQRDLAQIISERQKVED